MNVDSLVKEAFGEDAKMLSSVEMEKGASSRRYFRLTLEGPKAPPSAVLMALPEETMMMTNA